MARLTEPQARCSWRCGVLAALALLLLATVGPAQAAGAGSHQAEVEHERTSASAQQGVPTTSSRLAQAWEEEQQQVVQQQQQVLLQQHMVQPAAPLGGDHARTLQQLQCGTGTHRCGSACVANVDPNTCGKRCTPCPAPASGNGIAACSAAGACTVTCRKGFQVAQDCGPNAKSCKPACKRVCPPGQQANARGIACTVCPANTYKARASVATCIRCPNGTQALGKRASDHDELSDCKRNVPCPAGMEADAATLACRVCGIGFFKSAAGPGLCVRCPPAMVAVGPRPEDHDSAQDCRPISCRPGTERDTVAGGCKICRDNHYKPRDGPEPCTPCPPGSVTPGVLAVDRDEELDCLMVSCPAGQESDVSTGVCVTCPANTVKPGAGAARCTPCPFGTRTLGQQVEDHDEARDCLPGGLLPSGNLTGTSLEEVLASFDALYERARNNTGGRSLGGKGRGTTSSKGRPTRACLYECAGDFDAFSSRAVAHLAGSPVAYRSDNPADVRAGVNLLGIVYDQGACASCVGAVIAAAATTAVAAMMRVDARSLEPFAHDAAYHCAWAFGEPGARRSCGTGWSFENALRAMESYPGAFFMNTSCVKPNLTWLSSTASQLIAACNDAKSACAVPYVRCSSTALSDGIWAVQRHIRRYGAVIARIQVSNDFKAFFRANPSAVYGEGDDDEAQQPPSPPPDSSDSSEIFLHAVVLIGYNNSGYYWIARNSWGPNWADSGIFRIAFGVLGVGHPEDTFGLHCESTSSDAAASGAWDDPWRVTVDPDAPGCHLYTATTKDTISGIADHFGVDVLQLVEANTRRGVIPTKPAGDPARPEPQLDGPWGGKVFQLCGISADGFARVAQVVCTEVPAGTSITWAPACSGTPAGRSCAGLCAPGLWGAPTATCSSDGQWILSGSCSADPCVQPGYCNGNANGCQAGVCMCKFNWIGQRCQTLNETLHNISVAGVQYVVHMSPTRTWEAAERRCQQDGLHLLRLYSQRQAISIHAAVSQVNRDPYWIGLHDADKDRTFVWSADGAQLTGVEASWQPLQPDNGWGGEHCVTARKSIGDDHKWNDWPCSTAHRFVCGPASASDCARYPCSSNASSEAQQQCTPSCACAPGLEYIDDILGCVEPVFSQVLSIGDGVDYRLIMRPALSWEHANHFCRTTGTQLAHLPTDDHAIRLHTALLRVGYPRAGYWIGLSDRAEEGVYAWVKDNATTSYTRWLTQIAVQPDNYCGNGVSPPCQGEDCIQVDKDGFWMDLFCDIRLWFVCDV